MTKKEKILVWGALFSVVILVAFGILQEMGAKFLGLESQWIFISILPILIALFVGGYITRFSGFGFELEAALKEPVSTSIEISAQEAVVDVPGDEKQTYAYLESLSLEKRTAIRHLRFDYSRGGWYRAGDVRQYLLKLPELEFFEIRSKQDYFVCYLPADYFKLFGAPDEGSSIYMDRVEKFITALQNGNVLEEFRGIAISLTVRQSDDLLKVLKLMREEQVRMAAVVSESNRYLGVLFIEDVEKRIADAVLKSQEK